MGTETGIVYKGQHEEAGPCIIVIQRVEDGVITSLGQLYHCVHHSPDGFQWGYGGSGPADTALSILEDYFQRTEEFDIDEATVPIFKGRVLEVAYRLHQRFKWDIIASIEGDLEITDTQIREWLSKN